MDLTFEEAILVRKKRFITTAVTNVKRVMVLAQNLEQVQQHVLNVMVQV